MVEPRIEPRNSWSAVRNSDTRPRGWSQGDKVISLCFKLLTPARIKTTAKFFYNWISLSLQVIWRWGTYWVGSDRRVVRSHWGQWRGTDLLPNQTDFPKHFYFSWIRYGGRRPQIASPQTTLNPSDTNCLHDRVVFKENINAQKSTTVYIHTCIFRLQHSVFLLFNDSDIGNSRNLIQNTNMCLQQTAEPRQQHRYERRGTAVAQIYRMYLKCLVTSKILGQTSKVIFSHYKKKRVK
jgi:hypothetical protein